VRKASFFIFRPNSKVNLRTISTSNITEYALNFHQSSVGRLFDFNQFLAKNQNRVVWHAINIFRQRDENSIQKMSLIKIDIPKF
jgi:hypothetical protein